MAAIGIDPWALMARRSDPTKLADFLEAFEEDVEIAFVDALRQVPGKRSQRPAILARGTRRRWQFDDAFRAAAAKAGFAVVTGETNPPTWSYPLLRAGAFSFTLGIVDRPFARSRRRLRCRGKYMRRHVERNDAVDPQGRLSLRRSRLASVIPNGALGAVIVIEGSLYEPDRPRYIGVWVPCSSLSYALYQIPLKQLISFLRRSADEAKPRKLMTTKRRQPVRKLPVRKAVRRKADKSRD